MVKKIKGKLKILFICKYNRFRSRVAEAYFNKINKNKKIITRGAGIIRGEYPLAKEQVEEAKKLGINIKGRPQAISTKLLKWPDIIVIVADNVPNFIKKEYGGKTIRFEIKDVKTEKDRKDDERAIKQIINKIDKFVKQINKEGK